MRRSQKNIAFAVFMLVIMMANIYNLYNNRSIDVSVSIQRLISTGETPENTAKGWKVTTAKKCWIVVCHNKSGATRERRFDNFASARDLADKINRQPSPGWNAECRQEENVTIVQDCVGDYWDGCEPIMCADL